MMGDMARRLFHSFVAIVLGAGSVFSQVRASTPELNGRIVDQTGAGIANATIVASGVGFNGWALTDSNGSFHLRAAGRFISVRDPGLKAQLLRISELPEPVVIPMETAGESARTLPPCSPLLAGAKPWIGGGLKIDPGGSRFKGPVNGEHDSHWYVTFAKYTLHIVDGYASHAGLPWEELLANSERISVRSWEFEEIVGLDMSGVTENGMRWRWLGAPVSDAVEYSGATWESAEYFDRMIETTCFGSVAPV